MSETEHGWIGVDLDGTLARYDGWIGDDHIGEPIGLMVDRVKAWINEGREIRIFTARVYGQPLTVENDFHTASISRKTVRKAIEEWCQKHIGTKLPITCEKDYGMIELWDDRCVQVEKNTGRRIGECANRTARRR